MATAGIPGEAVIREVRAQGTFHKVTDEGNAIRSLDAILKNALVGIGVDIKSAVDTIESMFNDNDEWLWDLGQCTLAGMKVGPSKQVHVFPFFNPEETVPERVLASYKLLKKGPQLVKNAPVDIILKTVVKAMSESAEEEEKPPETKEPVVTSMTTTKKGPTVSNAKAKKAKAPTGKGPTETVAKGIAHNDGDKDGYLRQLSYYNKEEVLPAENYINKITCKCGNVRYVKNADLFQVHSCKPCTMKERRKRRYDRKKANK